MDTRRISAGIEAAMNVRVLAFARIREIVGFSERDVAAPERASAHELWGQLLAEHPALAELASSTRIARNGTIVPAATELADGDEVAFLPPVGGG
jgi:molybdopterin converting factor subunit 1